MTTPDTLAHIEAVLAAATEGPWLRGWWSAQAESKCICADKGELLGKRPQTIYPGVGPFHVHATDFFEDEHRLSGPAPACLSVAGNYDYEEGGIVRDADATFIAFSRNTYPEALAVVRDVVAITDLSEDDIRDYEQGACFFCGHTMEVVPGPRGGVTGERRRRPAHDATCSYVALRSSVAAFLAKTQEYVPAARDATEAGS